MAAIVASLRATLNSVAQLFTIDIFNVLRTRTTERELLVVRQFAAIAALVCAIALSVPLLGNVGQAFQYVQNFSGFITPGVTSVFLLGLFWSRTTERGALVAAVGSPVLSALIACFFPDLPFMHRVECVFVVLVVSALAVSALPQTRAAQSMPAREVSFATTPWFNFGAIVVIGILVSLYATLW